MPEPAAHSLRQTQAWMQSIISYPSDLSHSVHFAKQQFDLLPQQLITQQYGISAQERLAIYKRGYLLRLLACIRADYPMLLKHWGDELFDTFARAYLINTPSSSYTLFDLSKQFPEFLSHTRPPDTELTTPQIALLDLPIELAQLERIQLEVLRAKGTEEDEKPDGIELADFSFLFGGLTLTPHPCLRLLECSLPVLDVYSDLEKNEPMQTLEKGIHFIALSRMHYRLQMQELKAWQYYFLHALVVTKNTQEAIHSSSKSSGEDKDKLLADLWLWLPLALQQNFIVMSDNQVTL